MSTFGPTRKDIHRLIGPERLAKYKAAAKGDRALAFELYRWNVQISAALFESMHYFEIGFRNTAHEAMQSKKELVDPGGPPWFDNPHFPLQGQGPRVVNLARRRASTDTETYDDEGRIIAELTFGFWSSLLSEGYNRLIWRGGLAAAYPLAKRKTLHAEVSHLVRLRNRVAHHEPIHTCDLHRAYQRLITTSEYVSPRLGWWIDSTSRIPQLLRERPRAGS